MEGEYQNLKLEELRDGPLKDRKCTDVLFLLVFLVFFTSMVVVGFLGFSKGDPDLLIYPYDSAGFQCGRPSTPTNDFNYLYYVNPDSDDKTTVCVKFCPSSNGDNVIFYQTSYVISGTFKEGNFIFTFKEELGNDTDTNESIHSSSFLKHFCIPKEYEDEITGEINYGKLQQWARDITICWTMVLGVFAIAVGVSIIYLVLLRYCVGVVLWGSIFSIIGLLALGGYLFYEKGENDYNGSKDDNSRDFMKGMGITLFILAGIALLVTLLMCNRIRLAVAIMKSAAIFFKDVWEVVFVPVAFFFISAIFLVFWVLALVYIYTSGTIPQEEKYEPINSIDWDNTMRNSFYFELLGIVWIIAIKIALVQFIIAFACSVWYFYQDRERKHDIVCEGVKYALFKHLGSLALGSFLLATVWMVKWMLQIIAEKLYKEEAENRVLQCLCGCAKCCVDCFERFIKFLDSHAYIRIALTGEGFCEAAQNAMGMVVMNAGKFLALSGVGSIFQLLGRVFITVVSSYLGYWIITNSDHYSEEINSPAPPTVIFVVSSYLVASMFMSIYEVAADTIIQAYILDHTLHKGEPVFAPEPIKEFMEEHSET